jgi:hypothetical protein
MGALPTFPKPMMLGVGLEVPPAIIDPLVR